jgi:hypothetical protein
MKLISFAESDPVAWIELNDGTPILMEKLDQHLTYAGLLLGVPNERTNRNILDAVRRNEEARVGKPHVIEPRLIPFTVKQQRLLVDSAGRRRPRGSVEGVIGERLPRVTCIGVFRCPATIGRDARDQLFGYSAATLVWFQDAFAMPISPDIHAEIRALEWAAVTIDLSD